MNAVIVEDESLIAEEMKANIAALAPDVQVIEMLPSLKAARKWFMNHAEPDLLFMDIRLSDGLSFELFDQFVLHCPVIFCTAYEEYAIRAFKVNGIDYLLKPVQEEDLKKAIDKVRNLKDGQRFVPGDLQQLVQYFSNPSLAKNQYKERFVINSGNKWAPVETKDIAVFYKDTLNYVYTFNGNRFIYDFSALEDIEDVLDPAIFFRANRQAIINIYSIQSVKPHGNQKLVVQLKHPLKLEIDISREKAPFFKKWMDR
ncbi:LytR/AlgR family response regulator transcription factor [Niabella drilacis]|uniref:Two component transcriptional regulator, LytTR family n=1 Tax=Niabella drilacis (strain DSM 25811 / CCM 8410 / CCUG 62505 / LMG 26954 / E90) TaxID=1285928 RepID=A0A1G6SGQ8_NIADE|nr:LytTR family DNA-binding domain-containing protein [Niabella drilacis]SDD15834.1 two component transcriptional regulator, LytTR family [Niabella drilacis]